MFSHVAVGTNDLERAKLFYDATLGQLGYGEGQKRAKGDYVYLSDTGIFIVTPPIDGQPATHANGGTIGFTCRSVEEVERWHAAGIATGGKTDQDPPGIRNTEAGSLYLAYLRDPDGNKLCAMYRLEDRLAA
ncbi:MAG TPA: VOC family protein [Dongiaceae bacterium]|nr:VOC family protein [Dongiaceae bacterium]